jgi:hypothetical protein
MQQNNSGKNNVSIQGGKYDGCIRVFFRDLESRSPDDFIAYEMFIGLIKADRSIKIGEFLFVIKWYNMESFDEPDWEQGAELEIREEEWDLFSELSDFFHQLRNLVSPKPDDVIQVLLQCGFVDVTEWDDGEETPA